MRTLKLIGRFYGEIYFANFLITLSCIYLLGAYAGHGQKIIAVTVWYKVISIFIIFFGSVFYNRNELYYYQNLGISKGKLCVSTTAIEVLSFAMLIIFNVVFGVPFFIMKVVFYMVLILQLYLYTR